MKPWLRKQWCIPAEKSGEFVAHMEDILELYALAYDPQIPMVCMDEASRQHIKETRTPIPMSPGSIEKYDCEYERNGVSNVFMFFEPLGGTRHVQITDRRTKEDWAHAVKDMVDIHYPEAAKIRLVMDNLNTHGIGSLYETFPAAEALRIAKKLEIHHTPKHGSWLNMAEIELGILSRQCLKKRIPDQPTMRKEVQIWEQNRNNMRLKVDWQFSTKDARIKLKKLYPSF